MARQIRVEILGDARSLRRAFGDAERAGSGFARGIGKVAVFAGAALGAAGLAGALKGAVDAARESQKIGRQTEAVIRSTGGAAKVSAKQVGDLAGAISRKTGVDDEAIQSGQNLLLTFTNVRNEAGKGNRIFDQASAAIVDMTSAMNNGKVTSEGLKATTIQVGKALNDPIKGMTALSKVGVTFTKGQKDQIKALVESGDRMGAQKIILAELAKEFGGSAAAVATPWDRLKVTLGNVQETIGGAVLPVIDRLTVLMANRLPGALRFVQTAWGALTAAVSGEGITSDGFIGAVERVGITIRAIVLGVKALVAAFKDGDVTSDGFVGQMERLGVALRNGVRWVSEHKTLVLSLAGAIGTIITVVKVWQLATRAMAAAQAVLNVVMTANPIGIVVVALAALAVGLVIAYKRSATFRDIVDRVWAVLRPFAAFVLVVAGAVLGALFRAFMLQVRVMGQVIGWLLRVVTGTKTTGDALRVLGQGAVNLGKIFVSAVTFLLRVWLTVVGGIINGAAKALGWVPGLGLKLKRAAAAFNTFRDTANAALAGIENRNVTVKVKSGFSVGPGGGLGGRGGVAGGGVIDGPGTGTSDTAGLFALSRGELVVPAANVRAAGGARAVAGMVGMRNLRVVRAGGMAGGGVAVRVDADAGPIRRGAAQTNAKIDRIVAQAAKAIRESFAGGLAGIKAFIRSVDRLPYRWGAAGPGAYDCSGLVGAVYGKMRGDRSAGHGRRYFTTGSISTRVPGLKAGLGGLLNIGVTPGVGHMAGSYGGLGFEARSTRTGIFVGSAARSPASFARHYHMAKGGVVGRLDPREIAALLALPGVDIGGDAARARVAFDHAVADHGAWLPPRSRTLVDNRTDAWEQVGPPGRNGGGGVHLHFHGPVYGGKAGAREVADMIHAELLAKKGRNGRMALGLA